MNLSRVLDVSLPELPKAKEKYFRFNPEIVWREQTEKGVTTILAIGPQTRRVFTLTPDRWKLVRLFDGKRNYDQISKLYKRQYDIAIGPDAIRSFAELLDSAGFWLRTPEEEAMAMMEELKQRQKHVPKKRSVKDFTTIYVATYDADRVVSRVYRYIKFVYTPQFVLSSVVALVLMVSLWIARRDEVWRDSVMYWNMTGKTLWDVLEFYLIFAIVGFFHESGHALTAKNFGAEIHKTGLMLVYTVPAFFVETTEAIVHANYFQRMYVILAGFWFELMLCAVATFVWWGTAVGGAAHNIAYKFILVGGIMPVIFNMNPLMRLDGYLFFSKMLRIVSLKERSTAFLTGMVQSRIFKLPVKVEPLPRRRAIFFAVYAFLSGAYTYSVLLFLARLTYRVVGTFSPDWAFVPAMLVAGGIFRSRIEKFIVFLRAVYERHKETMKAHKPILVAAGVAVLIFIFLPIWKETVTAPVILEPKERASLTAHVPGRVENIFVSEGQAVRLGDPIASLRGLDVESEKSNAASQLQMSSAMATAAQLKYADYAGALAERENWSARAHVADQKSKDLSVASPLAGIIVAPHIRDLQGTYLTEGAQIAEVHDISTMRARIYVDEADMHSLSEVNGASIKLLSRVNAVRASVEAVSTTPEESEPGLIDATKYKGLHPPPHYVVSVILPNDGSLRSGMTGEAKLFGRRESLVGKIWRPIADFAGRKIW